MKVKTPEIVWHNKEPVFTVDFHRNGPNWRMVTGGADNDVKVWKVDNTYAGVTIHFLASLSRHTKAVNVVRFSPCGTYLASAGDDHVVLIWTLESENSGVMGNLIVDDGNKENWSVGKVLRGHLEDVYDLCWSHDSNFIITGSVDNSTIIWDVQKGHQVHVLKESKQYVQGVCWDPLGKVVMSLSSDRTLRVYGVENRFKCLHSVSKLSTQSQEGESKNFRMWIDEGLNSFFRRLTFTPDGSFLIVPSGRYEVADKSKNATYIFSRSNWTRPVLQLPCPDKPTVAVKCCPVPFQLREEPEASLTSLPYRMVYAVASLDSILLYDTQHSPPFGYVSNIHYSGITDLTWSNDGSLLVVSSSDCYCSFITFEEGELGTPLDTAVMVSNKTTTRDSAPGCGTSHPSQRLSPAETESCSSPGSVRASPSSTASSTASSNTRDGGCGLVGSKVKSPNVTARGTTGEGQGKPPRRIRPTMISSGATPVSTPPPPPVASAVPMDVDSSSNAETQDHETQGKDVNKSAPVPMNPSASSDASSTRPAQPRRVNFITLSSFKKPKPPSEPSQTSSTNS